MKCERCGKGLDSGVESVAGMLFCGTTCMVYLYREYAYKCREMWEFYQRNQQKFSGLRSSTVTYADSLVARAKNKYWHGKYKHDETERIIRNKYFSCPKQMNYALEKHRQGKFQRQIQAERQFDIYQQMKKEAKPLMQKYGITPEKNEAIKAEFKK